jgi:hypothetical protein
MSDNLQHSFEEIDRDLAPSWIALSGKVRALAANLKLRSAGTDLAGDAEHLSAETARLCDHVERLHAEVIDLVENLESRIPLPEPDASGDYRPKDVDCDEVDLEKIQIQREKHELRNDFKDVLKALFMWVDDPVDRVRGKR